MLLKRAENKVLLKEIFFCYIVYTVLIKIQRQKEIPHDYGNRNCGR